MITLIDIPSEKTLGLKISGKINKEGMDSVIHKIQTLMGATNQRLNIYVELEKWEGFTLAALYEDMKFSLPSMRRFAKEAIVTDKSWVAPLIKFNDKLFPSLELKAFPKEEKTTALKWVQE
ncbi:STAS/SEC14 domain-containing protein [Pseudodesulfovibrio sp. JC047]|uniref:STAS/SEC14 domain-containing protein n=1 Tax=Pseudodesulfovibrio sp. JC047 TaxID=2683199 RepID=UPI0013D04064|nr:STAS/SEC14 domain-containing protein [Pseudodesulfovibrio sp. JC047]NDV20618.1 STAS/SEC14 domain-containing protein [Pseudodesulfovibrio sp. JC047]